MLERDIEKKVCRHAEQHGWLVRKFTSPSQRAVPDRIFMRDGRTVFVEFKATGKRPTAAQSYEHDRLRAAGMTVHIIDTIEAGYALFP